MNARFFGAASRGPCRSPTRGRAATRARRRRRLLVEPLEPRWLLAYAPTTFADVVDSGDGMLSLREAVILANSTPGDDIIQLGEGTYRLTIGGTNEDSALQGDLDVTDNGVLTIVGAGAGLTIIDAGGLQDRVFEILPGATLNLSGVTITGGGAGNVAGGGVLNAGTLNVSHSAISGNQASHGGAVLSLSGGSVTIADSVLEGNTAASSGGAVLNDSGTLTITRSTVAGNSTGGSAGGLRNYGTGQLTVRDSTLSGNSAAGLTGPGWGGAVWGESSGSIHVVNSTISGNRTNSYGGGIHSEGTLNVLQSTIFGNRADADGNDLGDGGGISGAPVTLYGTIVAGNRRGIGAAASDVAAAAAGSYNLIGTGGSGGLPDGSGGNQVGIDPAVVLDPILAANGGPTLTHALWPASPARDAGDPALNPQLYSPPLLDDQRGAGFPRVADNRVDIGAVEFTAAGTELIVNGGFETGDFSGWTRTSSGAGGWAINDGSFDPSGPSQPLVPISDSFDAVSFQTAAGVDTLWQAVLVPDDVVSATLRWTDRIRNHADRFEDPGQEWRVLILDDGGNLIHEVFSTNPGDPLQQIGPNDRSFDITSVVQARAGQTIRISFEERNSLNYFNATLDDVSLLVVQPQDPPPAPDAVVSRTDDVVNGNTSSIAALIASDGGDGISLREAIVAANNTPGAHRIGFASGLAGQTIALSGGQLVLSDDITLLGLGADRLTIRQTAPGSRVFDVQTGVAVEFAGLTITGGSTSGDGGGIRNTGGAVTLTESAVSWNTAGQSGGGVFNTAGGTVTVVSSTISQNAAASLGGGIRNFGESAISILHSTLWGNTAGADGGGILSSNSLGTVRVTNSTISGNQANGNGGGIHTLGGLTIAQSTLYRNRADADANGTGSGGGISGSPVLLSGSIVAGNLRGSGTTASDLAAGASGGFNLIGTGGSGGLIHGMEGNQLGVNPALVLDPMLSDNGGPTLTHALLPTSPAVDAGDPSFQANLFDPPLATDQRGDGFPRIIFGQIDIGAVEFNPYVSQLIVNGGFETGDFAGWTRSGSGAGGWAINDGSFDPDGPGEPLAPISGSFDAVSFQSQPGLDSLWQDVMLPPQFVSVSLSWSDRVRNHASEFNDPQQEWRVLILDASGSLIHEVYSTKPGDPLQQIRPNHRSFDLTSVLQARAGQTIRISFQAEAESGYFNGTLDNVRLTVARQPPPPPDVLVSNVSDDVNGDTSSIAALLAADGGDGISLREAIAAANSTAGAQRIGFASGLAGQTILLSGGQLVLGGDVTLLGLGADRLTIRQTTPDSRVFEVQTGVAVELVGLTITGGSTSGDGGGIRNLGGAVTLTESVVTGNTAGFSGGGIFNVSGGVVTVVSSTISQNAASSLGGGIRNAGESAITLLHSTVAGNFAGGDGGGILSSNSLGTVRLTNSTISGNQANGYGGGILSVGGLTVAQSTVFGNRADADGDGSGTGGGIAGAAVLLDGTIVAGNLRGSGDAASDLDAAASGTYNLIGTGGSGGLAHGADGNQVGVNPAQVLDPVLTDNGGPTWTHALLPSSPAVNGGDPGFQASLFDPPLVTDQRGDGFPRIIFGQIDIGAVEFNPFVQQLIVNGGFETGDFTGWTRSSTAGVGWAINDGSFDPAGSGTPLPPISGSFDAVSFQGPAGIAGLWQEVLLPPQFVSASLSWSDRIRNYASTFNDPQQEWRVLILDANGSPVHEVFSTNPGDPRQQIDPNHRSFDLTSTLQPWAGQKVRIRFEEQHSSGTFNVSLDNVQLVIKQQPPPPPDVLVTNLDDVLNGNTSSIAGLIASDGGDGIGLREAIVAANNTPGAQRIGFASGLAGQTIALSIGQLVLSGDVTLVGLGADRLTIRQTRPDTRVFDVQAGAVVEFVGLTITGGSTTGDGGGIRNIGGAVTLTESTVTENAGLNGGGIFSAAGGSVTVVGSTIAGNAANATGGGIRNAGTGPLTLTRSIVSGNLAGGSGGGLLSSDPTAEVQISASTISGNSAGFAGGGLLAAGSSTLRDSTISGNTANTDGGGIAVPNNGTMQIINGTVSSNRANGFGGGIRTLGALTIVQSTIFRNRADADGDDVGGGGGISGAPVLLLGTIVAGNLRGTSGVASDIAAAASGAYNLVGLGGSGGLTDGVDGNQVGVDPTLVLDPNLKHNGGPTRTHALLPAGPAIDAGDPGFDPQAFDPPLLADQRGESFPRVVGGRIDVGAVEFNPLVSQLIVNGDFETGDFTGWTRTTTGGGQWAINDGSYDPYGPGEPLPPIAGSFDAVSSQNQAALNDLWQAVVVPDNLVAATLNWSDRIRNYAGSFFDPQQEWRVVISDPSADVIHEVFSTRPGDLTQQIVPNHRSFDVTSVLQALAGQTIRLSFQQQNQPDFFNVTLDDVSLIVVQQPPPPPDVIVSNAGDVVNGNTSSLAALIAADGGDGISLREAILAANSTAGTQRIGFAPSLAGGTIILDSSHLVLSGDTTLLGPGADQLTIRQTASGSRVFEVTAGVSVEFLGLTITGGSTPEDGGGIRNLGGTIRLTGSVVKENTAGWRGGGIFNVLGGSLTVVGSTISQNVAGIDGGGIHNFGQNTVAVLHSTLWGNAAGVAGGGIYSNHSSGIVGITSSTISGNQANGLGGGIHTAGGLTVVQSTVFGNWADADGSGNKSGGGISGAPVVLSGTIVAGNVSGAGGVPSDMHAAASGSYNLFGIGGSGGLMHAMDGNLVGIDPGAVLDPTLRINGGPTPTHALLGSSPALDAGDPAFDGNLFTPPLKVDQRGLARLADGTGDGTVRIDIGAFEAQQPPPGTLLATLAAGTLTITDTDAAGAANRMTILLGDGGLQISDAEQQFAAVPEGSTLSGDRQVLTIPWNLMPVSLAIALSGGDDSLTIDFSGGNPIPVGGLGYDGGPGSNLLAMTGGTFHSTIYTYSSTQDGTIRLETHTSGPRMIGYQGVTAITADIASPVVGLGFTAGSETITLGDAGGGRTAASSTQGAATTFANPAQQLEIHASSGTDLVNVNSLASGYASLVLSGDGASDVLNLDGRLPFAADHGLSVSGFGTVNLSDDGSWITASGTGSVTISALRNIAMVAASRITSADGDIVLSANRQAEPTTGGPFAGISLNIATIASSGGNVWLSGRGGTAGAANHGVAIQSGSQVSSAAGDVRVEGLGGASTGNANYGVLVSGANSRITAGGSLLVEGFGGGSGKDSSSNFGVYVSNAGTISGTAAGSVTVHGLGGNAGGAYPSPVGGFHHGVVVSNSGSRITSGDGTTHVYGSGGGPLTSSNNYGVLVSGGGEISSTGAAAAVRVEGFGGNSGTAGGSTTGVRVSGSSSRIGSGGGDIEVVGRALGASGLGIRVETDGRIDGTAGSATVTLVADSMELTSSVAVEAAANTVRLQTRTAGTRIDLGGSDVLTGSPLTLGLSAAELDRIVAGALVIGEAASGPITVSSAISRPASTDVELISGDAIVFNQSFDTGGGALRFSPGATDSLQPKAAGADAITAGNVTSFAPGSVLKIDLAGTTVDSQYDQLNVAGTVDLSGVALELGGSYASTAGDVFTIVSGDAVTGTFANLLQGATIDHNGRPLQIEYGTGFVSLTDVGPAVVATVVGRHVFYNNSYFAIAEGASDDDAIAPDKTALLPGQAAGFANYTSYNRGINGIVVDIADLKDTAGLTPGSFEFRVGNSSDPAAWALAPAPLDITVRPGAGTDGSDRVTIIWPDGAIRNGWLQVVVRADAATGLAAPDVFYFGNAVGESGNSISNAFVDGSDFAGARDNPRDFNNPAPLDFRWDYNRDGYVDGSDLAIARDNATNFLTALKLIAIPAAPSAPSPASMPAGEGEATNTVNERLEAAEAGVANWNAAALPSPSADERKSAEPAETPMGSPDLTAWTAVLSDAGSQHTPPRPAQQPSTASSLEESWEPLCLIADPLEAILDDIADEVGRLRILIG